MSYYRMGDKKMAAFGDRTAVNTKIQSVGSVVFRLAMIKLWNLIFTEEAPFKDDVFPVLLVHDEFDFCVRNERVNEFARVLVETMSSIRHPAWEYPLVADCEIGDTVGTCFGVEFTEDGKLRPKYEEKKEEVEIDDGPEEATEEDYRYIIMDQVV